MSKNAAQRKHDLTADSCQKELVKLIQSFSYGHHLHTVFSDFVELSALAISNSVDRAQFDAREKRYLDIVGKYKKEEVAKFPQMLGLLVESFELRVAMIGKPTSGAQLIGGGLTDVLGETYMMLGLGNDRAGQFFTLCEPVHKVNYAKSKIMRSPHRALGPEGITGHEALDGHCIRNGVFFGFNPRKEFAMNVFEALPEPAASRLRDGKLAPLAQIYYDRLSALKYAPATIRSSLFSLAHFSLWLKGRAFDLASLDRHIICFLDRHLPRCTCAAPVLRSRRHLSAALGHLTEVVRASGVGDEGPCDERDEVVLRRFDDYMSRAKGLAASTRLRRVAIVRSLLCMPTSAISPTAAELRAFLTREFSRISTASAGVTASTIRSYLLFRASEGDPVTHLLPVVAKPAHWRNSALPKTLAPDEIERLLRAFPSDLPSRLRCYAIVRCLVDLGLRGCEVIALNLDNIDWRAGTVSIQRGKTQRSDVLPLPHATGAAIADYMRLERPLTTSRRIFVRHIAPVDKPVSTAVVRKAVREAYRRAGLPYTGVHVLRHTLARRMLNSGSTLKEVADVLRHRELDASRVYAKVDFDHLALVAMPWPGSAS